MKIENSKKRKSRTKWVPLKNNAHKEVVFYFSFYVRDSINESKHEMLLLFKTSIRQISWHFQ